MKYIYFLLLIAGFTMLTSSRIADHINGQQEDYRIFSNVLKSKEGTLDMHLSADSVDFYLDILRRELETEKSSLEQFKLYSEMIARLNCGHTQVISNRTVQAEWLMEMKSLPIDVYLLGRRLIVGKIVPEDSENILRDKLSSRESTYIKPGSEILMIDSLTVPEMMTGISRYISSDEGGMEFKYFQASQMFEFYRHLAFPLDKDSVMVKYVTPKSDTHVVYMQPGKAPIHSMNERLMQAAREYNESELDMGKFKVVNGKYGYFRFTSFSASSGNAYDAFLKESFEELKRKKVKYLVVDLRGNTGGVMQYEFIKYFVGEGINVGRYIIAKPYSKSKNKYLRKVNMPYIRYAVLSWQQKRKVRDGSFNEGTIMTDYVDPNLIYDGEVCVITNEGTFSSASILASQLKTMAKAYVVGRPAGGSFYSGNAGTLMLKLPESGLEFSINPNTFYSHLDPVEDPLAIKQPDIYLDPLILDESDRNQFYFKQAISTFEK